MEYILNDLVKEIKELDIGIPIENDLMVSILLSADDMVLLAENEEDLQAMVDKLNKYCFKRRLSINIEKNIHVMHFRRAATPRSRYIFKCGDTTLSYASKYKYLRVL